MTQPKNPIICTKCGKTFRRIRGLNRIHGFWFCYQCGLSLRERMPLLSKRQLEWFFGGARR